MTTSTSAPSTACCPGTIDQRIDGMPERLAGRRSDPGFTGLHRIEMGLWTGAAPPPLAALATRLQHVSATCTTSARGCGSSRSTTPPRARDPRGRPARPDERHGRTLERRRRARDRRRVGRDPQGHRHADAAACRAATTRSLRFRAGCCGSTRVLDRVRDAPPRQLACAQPADAHSARPGQRHARRDAWLPCRLVPGTLETTPPSPEFQSSIRGKPKRMTQARPKALPEGLADDARRDRAWRRRSARASPRRATTAQQAATPTPRQADQVNARSLGDANPV